MERQEPSFGGQYSNNEDDRPRAGWKTDALTNIQVPDNRRELAHDVMLTVGNQTPSCPATASRNANLNMLRS